MLQVITALLIANSSHNAVPAKDLAPMILWLSSQYEVDPVLVTRIVLLESKGIASAYNKRTNDYGLMQLNYHTMKAYGISVTCAKDWKCNLESGIRILSDIKDKRTCRYNVGSGKLKSEKLKRCLSYERKLASIN